MSVLEEHDPSGTLLAHYRYAVTSLAMETPGGERHWYHQDALGSNVALSSTIDGPGARVVRGGIMSKI